MFWFLSSALSTNTDDAKLDVATFTDDVELCVVGSDSNPGPDLVVVDVVVTFDDDSSAVDVDFAVAAVMIPPSD